MVTKEKIQAFIDMKTGSKKLDKKLLEIYLPDQTQSGSPIDFGMKTHHFNKIYKRLSIMFGGIQILEGVKSFWVDARIHNIVSENTTIMRTWADEDILIDNISEIGSLLETFGFDTNQYCVWFVYDGTLHQLTIGEVVITVTGGMDYVK